MALLPPKVLSKQNTNLLMLVAMMILCGITVGLDLVFSRWQNTSFYLSESLLFSTFWLLFVPILHAQITITRRSTPALALALMTPACTAIHLFAYPALIWILSKLFFYHTFDYWQTFNFVLTAYGIKALIIYSLPYAISLFYRNRRSVDADTSGHLTTDQPPASMLVSDSNNRKISVRISEILYFSANSPYVNVHHPTKKYLQTGTLKSMEQQLEGLSFVRIHKSCLVNVRFVEAYQSRLNGDYDVTLADGTSLRVSRNYATAFRQALERLHQVKSK